MRAVIDIEKTGKHLKEMCKKKNVSISDIQRELHLKCPKSVYRWYCGVALPTVDHLYTLAFMLHVPIEELLVLKKILLVMNILTIFSNGAALR